MTPAGPSELRLAYKKAVDEWVWAIRAEEDLAKHDHSMTEMEQWDAAHLAEQDAQKKATDAREAYKDSLRKANYGI
jgi:thymidylate synthase